MTEELLQDIYRLTPMQEGMLFHALKESESGAYFEQGAYILEGRVDGDVLERSFAVVVQKYDVLRTIFRYEEGKRPLQIVLRKRTFKLKKEDISVMGDPQKVEFLEEFRRQDRQRGFDLARDSLFRAALFRSGEKSFVLVTSFHHIIMDGWSLGIVLSDLLEVYGALVRGVTVPRPEAVPYHHYITWWEGRDTEVGLKFWQEYLADYDQPVGLPGFGDSQTTDRYRPGIYNQTMDAVLTAGLEKMAKTGGVTLSIVFRALWGILLQRYNYVEDSVYGMVVSGRSVAVEDIGRMVGLLINTVPVRVQTAAGMSFGRLLTDIGEHSFLSAPHEYIQLAEIQSMVSLPGRLFDHILVYENYPLDRRLKGSAGEDKIGFRIERFELFERTHYGLSIALRPGACLELVIKYDANFYSGELIQQAGGHLINLARQAVSNIEINVGELELMSDWEKERILKDFNDTNRQYPDNLSIHGLFESTACRRPHCSAVTGPVQGNGRAELCTVTYLDLNRRAGALARRLNRNGIEGGQVVGLMLERSVEMIIGLLGVLKCGAAYLPVEPNTPVKRIDLMMADSGASVLIARRPGLPPGETVRTLTVCGKDLGDDLPVRSVLPVPPGLDSAAKLAYVLYTSGTTGHPRGVLVEHRSVVNLVSWFAARYELSTGSRILLLTTYTFDASVNQIFAPLLHGGSIVVAARELLSDIERLYRFMEVQQVEIVNFVPVFLKELLGSRKKIAALKYVLCGAERLEEKFKELLLHKGYVVYNQYGPTEVTVDALASRCSERRVDLGKPIDNVGCCVLDRDLNMLPMGAWGELHIWGTGLSRGYLNNPELTARKFIPLVPGQVQAPGFSELPARCRLVYRTGDRCRWLPDGSIDFSGRIDEQVKIRGFRVELGEIEQQLLGHESVKEAVVLAREEQGVNQLCAYIVLRSDSSSGGNGDVGLDLGPEPLKNYLSRRLPDYMIPLHFVFIDSIPLKPNGKMDRRSLPTIGKEPQPETTEAPQGEVEERLTEVWSEVLGRQRIGVNERFFDIGGDSIKSIQVCSRLRRHGLKLDIRDLLEGQTIRRVAGRVISPKDSRGEEGSREGEVVRGDVDLTPIQRWFWSVHRPAPHHFNQSVMLYRNSGFDQELIRRVFNDLVAHHDALRLVYRFGAAGEVSQVNRGLESRLFDLEVTDISSAENSEEACRRLAGDIQRSIDLQTGPLVKLGLFKGNDGDYLLIVIHHLVVDGVSWRIILEDFAFAYCQALNGEAIRFPRKSDSFRLWARRLKEFAAAPLLQRELKYWQRIEAESIEPLPRDGEIPDAEREWKNCHTSTFNLETAETKRLLSEANRAYSTGINDLLLASLGLALNQWRNIGRTAVALEGHGREDIMAGIDIGRTVGWFTTRFPLILDMSKAAEPGYQIKWVKETLRKIPRHGIGFGMLKYLSPAGSGDTLQSSLEPEISFNFLGEFAGGAENFKDVFTVSQMGTGGDVNPETRQPYTLAIGGVIVDKNLKFSITYFPGEYETGTIERLVECFKINLLKVIEHCCSRDRRELTPWDVGYGKLTLEEFRTVTEITGGDTSIERIYPLTPMQLGMLYHRLREDEANSYHEQGLFWIKGKLDADLLEKSLNRLVERYDVLRSVFVYERLPEPVQVVLSERLLKVKRYDISPLSAAERDRQIEAFSRRERSKGFNLSGELLLRMTLFEEGADRYRMMWDFHHILFDGWCLGILFKDLLDIYNYLERREAPELAAVPSYADYIDWLESRDRQAGLLYWRHYLDGYEQPVGLPKFGNPSSRDSHRQSRYKFAVGTSLTAELEKRAGAFGVTVSTVIQALWGILLQRYNDVDDAVYGVVVSGRPAEVEGIERMVGLLINTLPLRVQSTPGISFNLLLKDLHERSLASAPYEYVPLAEIQAAVSMTGILIDHILVFENYPLDERLTQAGREGGVSFEVEKVEFSGHTNYELTVVVMPGSSLEIVFIYDAGVYGGETLYLLAHHFQNLLRQVTAEEEVPAAELELSGEPEKQRLLKELNESQCRWPRGKTLDRLIEDQSHIAPHLAAVLGPLPKSKGEDICTLTYRELSKRADAVAVRLKEAGVVDGGIVAVLSEPSAAMVGGLLGILKAGSAYLPIDPGSPPQRRRYVLADSGTGILMTDRSPDASGLGSGVPRIIDLNDIDGEPAVRQSLSPRRNSSSPAYVIYTSGTTGRPKGVIIEHGHVVRLLLNDRIPFDFGPGDTWTLFHSFCFDFSVWEMYGALLYGGKLLILPRQVARDTHEFLQVLKRHRVTVLNQTPSAFFQLAEVEGQCPAGELFLHTVIFGGEALNVERLREWRQRYPRIRLVNMYGITETTVHVTVKEVREEDIAGGIGNIGRPLPATTCYVMSRQGRLMPPGGAGELYVGGAGVGRGYLNRPGLTAERFVRHPRIQGERLYRTGDRVRLKPSPRAGEKDELVYLGRIDQQVQIRGFRVEPGEVESQLHRHPRIKESVVSADIDRNGDYYLVAYLVLADAGRSQASPEKPAVSTWREFLSRNLPDYMIPAYFIYIDIIPLTPNGKIDRKRLPPIEEGLERSRFTAPVTPVEKKLIEIWRQVLSVNEVGIHDSFFELGGQSLNAVTLVSLIQKEFGVKIPLVELFRSPTVKELALLVGGARQNIYENLRPTEKRDYYPLSSSQKRIYLLHRLGEGGIHYNIPSAQVVRGVLERERLGQVFQQIVSRHESLRTFFVVPEGIPLQRIPDRLDVDIEYYRAGGEPGSGSVDSLIRDFVRPFDLSKPPLLRVGVTPVEGEEYLLLADIHHIVADGFSIGLLIREFAALYNEGEKSLSAPAFQYRDFALWQSGKGAESVRSQEGYWLDKFAGELPLIHLPTNHPRPAEQSYKGGSRLIKLDRELALKLREVAAAFKMTLFMVLLAVFDILLHRYSGDEDIVVGTAVAARPYRDLHSIVGMFVNTLALRSRPQADKTTALFLDEVREEAVSAFDNQLYPFEELVDRLGVERDTGRNPLFDVMFDLQNKEAFTPRPGPLDLTPYPLAARIARFDLTLTADEGGEEVTLTAVYCRELFDHDTIDRLMIHFRNLARSLTGDLSLPLGRLDFLEPAEKKLLLHDFNDTAVNDPVDRMPVDLLSEQARRTPRRIAAAASFSNHFLTYGELDRRASGLAVILSKRGLGEGHIAALMVDPSIEVIVGIVGIWKSGAAYLPIDTGLPAERTGFMLRDSSAAVLITAGTGDKRLVEDVPVITIPTGSFLRKGLYRPQAEATPTGPAYLIYTSGTTGRPKGVLISRRNLVNHIYAFRRGIGLSADDVILQQAAYSFDLSIEEMIPALTIGSRLLIAGLQEVRDINILLMILARHRVTVIDCVPLLINEINRRPLPPHLRIVVSGGDILKPEYVDRLLKEERISIYNTYGPTETTISCTIHRCLREPDGPVRIPIGRPLSHYRLLVVNPAGQLQPLRAAGELWIGGRGVGRGYLNRPELTAEKFAGPERFYRSGDLCRFLPDGHLEFLGRIDHQVKIRGFRIETGEIEKRLLEHRRVDDVLVTVAEDEKRGRCLAAYIEAPADGQASGSVDAAALKEFLSQRLPHYMIPPYFVFLDRIPRNSSGKPDRRSLPSPLLRSTAPLRREPVNRTQLHLLEIWQEVLGIEGIGIDENFFDLGGNSLLILQVHEKINAGFSRRIRVVDLFARPTIAALAALLEGEAVSPEIRGSKQRKPTTGESTAGKEIAIIGMALRIRDIDDLETFWKCLASGQDCIGPLPMSRRGDIETFLKSRLDQPGDNGFDYLESAYLEEIDKFDYRYFKLSPREAALMDPRQRLFLQTALAALEDAGYGGERLKGSDTGVFVGHSSGRERYEELVAAFSPAEGMHAVAANMDAAIPSRLSYWLDLKGPALLIDTACSSALVALHTACRAIRAGECSQAVVGAVKIQLLPLDYGRPSEIRSADGRTRAFDDNADGIGSGEGVMAVVLKSLERALPDRDHIYAVIKGSAVNQDGRSIGITAPDAGAQAEVIRRAWEEAAIDPVTLSYIETHGTGTKLGDPIEIEGLTRAFRHYTDRLQFCAIGSVKANIGHLDNAAGLAGLFKAVAALQHRQIPPLVHYRLPNREIDFVDSPVYINDELTEWQTAGIPRRCGISSFGLSGTNCHVVLEEYKPSPAPGEEAEPGSGLPLVLCISARTAASLGELVSKFRLWLQCRPDASLHRLCATANTGRGHYNHRLALRFSGYRDLFGKLDRLAGKGLANDDKNKIFYGHFRLVPLNKQDREPTELNEEERAAGSGLAAECLETFLKHGRAEALNELLALYVEGADIDWQRFYGGYAFRKISLPTYPFASERCWLEPQPESRSTPGRYHRQVGDVLLDRCLARTPGRVVYTADLSLERHWLLREHRVGGRHVLVGTAYLEMALSALRDYNGAAVMELREVVLPTPLVAKENRVNEVQLLIDTVEDHLEFRVVSPDEGDENAGRDGWLIHAAGRISPLAEAPQKRWDIEALQRQCPEVLRIDTNEPGGDAGLVRTGPRWRNLRTVYSGTDQALAYLELPEQFRTDLEDFRLHPPLLDSALNFASGGNGGEYLPFMYRHVSIYLPIPPALYSFVERRPATGSETLVFDVTLLTTGGEVVARFDGYTLKRFRPRGTDADMKGLFHVTRWQPASLPPSTSTSAVDIDLVIRGSRNSTVDRIADDLRRNLEGTVIEVDFGDRFRREGEKRFIIDNRPGGWERLLSEWPRLSMLRVILLGGMGIEGAAGSLETLEERLDQTLFGLFYLSQALAKLNVPAVELYILTRHAVEVTGQEKEIYPELAASGGLARVIYQENPNIRCRWLDIDDDTDIRHILAEMNNGRADTSPPWRQSAYRRNCRYEEEFTRLDPEKVAPESIEIRQEGVYLISGGLGGIGLSLARYLASRDKVRLVLFSRTPLPPRSSWKDLLIENRDTRLVERIRIIRDIEALGSTVRVDAVDAADENELPELIADVHRHWGAINGIIHCAGVAGGGFLLHKEESLFRGVLRPKIQAAWLLDRLTADDQPDFFILCSSLTSLTGAPGQGDYTAANSYLDAFASWRNRRTSGTLAINWTAWKEIGMAVDYGAAEDDSFLAIGTAQAVRAFDRVLGRKISRVAVGAVNWPYLAGLETEMPIPIRLSPEIRGRLRKEKSVLDARKGKGLFEKEERSAPQLRLTGRTAGDYTETEERVGRIWAGVLGFHEIDIFDNYYDMGGDSIAALTIVNAVNRQLDRDVGIVDIFNHLTVEAFARFLDDRKDQPLHDEAGGYRRIEAVEKKEFYPLSAAQKRLFTIHQFDPDGTHYNLPDAVVFRQPPEMAGLKQAFSALIGRHESLRTSFRLLGEQPVQLIAPHLDFDIEYIAAPAGSTRISGEIAAGFVRPFDLAAAPLLRAALVVLPAGAHVLLVDVHHIVADALSCALLIRQFEQLYRGEPIAGESSADHSASSLRIQYKDFAIWQNRLFASPRIESQKKFWLQQFEDDIPLLDLPTDFPRPGMRSSSGDTVTVTVPAAVTAEARTFAGKHEATLYMLLLSVLYVVLHRYSGQEDIVIGSSDLGRPHPDLEGMIGMFINILPMRNFPVSGLSFTDFLAEVKKTTIRAFENRDYQYDELVEILDVRRDFSRNPLADIMFSFMSFGTTPGGGAEARNDVAGFLPHGGTLRKSSQADITLFCQETDKLSLSFEYCDALFSRQTMERLARHFSAAMAFVLRSPEAVLGDIELLDAGEKEELLFTINDTAGPYPGDRTVQQLFEAQVRRRSHRMAVIETGTGLMLSYNCLNQRANRLAGGLRRSGFCRNHIAAIALERSVTMIIGIWAVLKAGGAYLPLDASLPAGRIRFMLRDSGAGWLLATVSPAGSSMPSEPGCILVDPADERRFRGRGNNLEYRGVSGDPAYVIYTSGTSGRPKGVLISHRSLVNYACWAKEYYIGRTSAVLTFPLFSTLSFDFTVTSIYPPLLFGHRIRIYPGGTGEVAFNQVVEERRADILKATPGHLRLMAESSVRPGRRLKKMVVGGEELTGELAGKIEDMFDGPVDILNEYGPTEATVGCMIYRFNSRTDRGRSVPIGTPIANTGIYILDRRRRLVPVGVAGELHISGDCLAAGYLNNPDLTAEKFTHLPPDPADTLPPAGSQIIYRTGDLARYLPEGNVMFLGRLDRQVKIRGYRIELAEIRQQLLAHREVKEVLVADRQEGHDERYLCAYVLLHTAGAAFPPGGTHGTGRSIGADHTAAAVRLRHHLSLSLPGYMIPPFFVFLDALPLTPNGKIDYKALPNPLKDRPRESSTYTAPRKEVEIKLASIWSRLIRLDCRRIGIDDNFFELGGHSLRGVALLGRIEQEWGYRLPFARLFETPTIREIARHIEERAGKPLPPLPCAESRQYYPLSSAQKRLYLLQQMVPDSTVYNIPEVTELAGDPDPEKVIRTFKRLIERQGILRSSFIRVAGQLVQRVHGSVDFEIEFYDCSGGGGKTGQHSPPDIIDRFIRPFDLSKPPLLRVGLIRVDRERHLLMVDMHHIVTDGVSTGIILEEWLDLYRGRVLPPLRVQYRDFALYQQGRYFKRSLEWQEQYWLRQFDGEIPVLQWAADRPRPPVRRFAGALEEMELDARRSEDLKKLALATGTTPFMLLLSLFGILLSRLGGQEDIVVGTPAAGRRHPHLQRVIGMFVNTLALRCRPAGTLSFISYLQQVRAVTLAAFENQDYPFEDLVDQLPLAKDTGRNPIFDVMLVMQNMERTKLQVPGITLRPHAVAHRVAKFDLTLQVFQPDDRFRFAFEYCTELFDSPTIRRWIVYFENLLDTVLAAETIRLSRIDILPEREKQTLIYELNDTDAIFPRHLTVMDLFTRQIESTPGLVAVADRRNRLYLSYLCLEGMARSLARRLLDRGITVNHVVPVLIERSVALWAAVAGIVRCGAAYLPIDAGYPAERIRHMLTESGASILVTTPAWAATLSVNIDCLFNRDRGVEEDGDDCSAIPLPGPEDWFYVIYTSGSTGRPKGVPVRHGGFVNLIEFHHRVFGNRAVDRLTQMAAPGFDASAFEIWPCWTCGAALYLVDDETRLDPAGLKSWLISCGITIAFAPTPLAERLLNLDWSGESIVLRALRTAGDRLGSRPSQPLPFKLYNLYGPTEDTVWTSFAQVEASADGGAPPIGRPVANHRVYILGTRLEILPFGVPGELCIGGDGLSPGYLNQPELTARKFVESPLPMSRSPVFYRSGDLARYLPGGDLEFLGRIDHQVKIRGHRIEPGEIEQLLRRHPDVTAAAVLAADLNGGTSLCAYLVFPAAVSAPSADSSDQIKKIREYLTGRLPAYMIPAYFIPLGELPLTPGGKLDRRRLPVPQRETPARRIAPRTGREKLIAAVWADVLKVPEEQVGTTDNFFEMGGNSLNILTVRDRLQAALDRDIPVVTLFEYPMVAALAAYLDPQGNGGAGGEPEIDRQAAVTEGKERRHQRLQQRKRRI